MDCRDCKADIPDKEKDFCPHCEEDDFIRKSLDKINVSMKRWGGPEKACPCEHFERCGSRQWLCGMCYETNRQKSINRTFWWRDHRETIFIIANTLAIICWAIVIILYLLRT